MNWSDLAVVSGFLIIWAVVQPKVAQFGITSPMALVAGGLVLEHFTPFHVSLSSQNIKVLAELALVLFLFSDAARVRLGALRRDVSVAARLLGIGLPLTVLAGALLAWALLPGVGGWLALLVGACLAPTDAGLGAGVVTDLQVPARIRQALNVESGLNDGICAPVVTLAIAGVAGAHHEHLSVAAAEILGGAALGVGVGVACGALLALGRRWGALEQGPMAVAAVAVALGCYALSQVLAVNGFVACFVAGLCFGTFRAALPEPVLYTAEDSGQLLAGLVWFAFGAAMLAPSLQSPLLWKALLYAVASLTVVRAIPVVLSLLGTGLSSFAVGFIAWFGPRGIASVVFTLLAIDELGGTAKTLLLPTVSLTVALSVLAHGLSASPLIRRLGAVEPEDPSAPQIPTRRSPTLGRPA